jgi:hypothetical protein
MRTSTRDGWVGIQDFPQTDVRLISKDVPIDLQAPAIARKALTGLADVISGDMLSHAQVLTSDLVSQRVRHTPPDRQEVLKLDVSLTPKRLRVQVTDAVGSPAHDADKWELNWELQIVAELADRWGMRQHTATTLWFELDR